MSKGTKIALGVVGGLLTLCALIGIAGFLLLRSVGSTLIVDDPEDLAAAAENMIDYRLPRGYKEDGLINILLYKMLLIAPENPRTNTSRPLITVIEFSQSFGTMNDTTLEQIQQSMEDSAQTGNVSLELLSTEEVIIRDQNVVVSNFSGKDSAGTEIRQTITSTFDGKNGVLMIMIMGPAAGWSDAEVDAFIGSIR